MFSAEECIECLVMAGTHHCHLVYMVRYVAEQLRYLDTGLSMLLEAERRAHQRGLIGFGELQLKIGEAWWCRIPMQPDQLRFRVEGVQVTGPAVHKQINDALRPSGKMRVLGRQKISRKRGHGAQREGAKAASDSFDELPPASRRRSLMSALVLWSFHIASVQINEFV